MEPSSNPAPAKSHGALITTLVIIILILAGGLAWLYTSKNTTEAPVSSQPNADQANTSQNPPSSIQTPAATATQNGNQTFNLRTSRSPLAYAFELPAGYVTFFEEGFEGGYGARVTVLKETSTGIFEKTGVEFFVTAESALNATGKGGDAIIDSRYKSNLPGASLTTIAGNKAVNVPSEMTDTDVNTTGFFPNSRMPQYPFIIEAYYYPPAGKNFTFSRAEYDKLLKNLKITATGL